MTSNLKHLARYAPLLALPALAVAFLVVRARYSGTAPALPIDRCDSGLWPHVYRPHRLRVLAECTAVEGRVVFVEREPDGDLHVGLDPDDASVLNLVNAIHGGRLLVVEAVCDHESALNDVKAACAGFTSKVTVPAVGDRIRVTGAYVTDRENGWNEVHPVTRIDLSPSPRPP